MALIKFKPTSPGTRMVVYRPADEITHILGVPAAPAGTRALNYAFDVTPAELVTAIVTENRLIFPGQPGTPARG